MTEPQTPDKTPSSAPLIRTSVTWTMDDFNPLRRAFRFGKEREIDLACSCALCKTPLQLLGAVTGPSFTLRCACTDRVVKRGI